MFGIPFSLQDWESFTIDVSGSPKVFVSGPRLSIRTDEEAGGMAYFLPEPIPLKVKQLELQWNWLISQFPKSTPTIPLQKKDSDFALRLGLILSDGNWRVPLPYKFRKAMMRRGHALTYVLFYSAVPKVETGVESGHSFGNIDLVKKNPVHPFRVSEVKTGKPHPLKTKCAISPFHDSFANCFVPVELNQMQTNLVLPIPDIQETFQLNRMDLENTKIIGLWLFADSDNSDSQSNAWIENIQVRGPAEPAGVAK